MKKIDYLSVRSEKAEEQKVLDVAAELEVLETDAALPSFTKEIPIGKKAREKTETIELSYKWGLLSDPNMKIRQIEFRKGEELGDVYKINAEDGIETAVISWKNSLYIIRKTSAAIAKALLNVYKRISAFVEDIVGYFTTVLGNSYVLSKIEKGCWAFDREIAGKEVGIKPMDAGMLSEGQKKRLSELIVSQVGELHSRNLVLGNFSLKNFILTNESGYFTDLRRLRFSKKPALLVEEIKKVLKYLVRASLLDSGNVFPVLSGYCVANEHACREWYKERLEADSSKHDIDTYDIATAIESEIV